MTCTAQLRCRFRNHAVLQPPNANIPLPSPHLHPRAPPLRLPPRRAQRSLLRPDLLRPSTKTLPSPRMYSLDTCAIRPDHLLLHPWRSYGCLVCRSSHCARWKAADDVVRIALCDSWTCSGGLGDEHPDVDVRAVVIRDWSRSSDGRGSHLHFGDLPAGKQGILGKCNADHDQCGDSAHTGSRAGIESRVAVEGNIGSRRRHCGAYGGGTRGRRCGESAVVSETRE